MKLYNEYYYKDVNEAIQNTCNFQELKGKSILITGASGLIGSFLIDMLLYANRYYDMNIKIFALGRSTSRLEKRFYKEVNNSNLTFIEQDIEDELTLNKSCDYIVHAAGNAHPGAFSEDPIGTVRSSVLGIQYLLEYAKVHKVKRVLFISSGEVYGQQMEEAIKEDFKGSIDPINIRSCYPLGKQVAENLCIAYYKQFELETIIARPCHIYGPTMMNIDNRATAEFIRAGIAEESIIMKSEGNQVRSYCYISDCAAALLTVLLCGKAGEAYNIAYSEAVCSIREFAMEVANTVNKAIVYNEMSDKEKINQTPITRAVLDASKLQALGWKGRININQGIEHTIKILTT